MDEQERERPRPRVVDKRASTRASSPAPEPRADDDVPEAQAEPGPAPQEEPPGRAPSGRAADPRPALGDVTSLGGTPPAGEHPSGVEQGATTEEPWTPEQEAEARRSAAEMSSVPSLDWVVNVAVTLANVAGTKIESGKAADAKLAIDALAGIVQSVGTEMPQVEGPLRQTLAQLQMAYVQATTTGSPTGA